MNRLRNRPNLLATDVIAAHSESYSSRCARTSRTASLRISSGYLRVLVLLHPLKGWSLHQTRRGSVQAARPRPEKPRASSPPTSPTAASTFSTLSPSQNKPLLHLPTLRAKDLLPAKRRQPRGGPATYVVQRRILAISDEFAMNRSRSRQERGPIPSGFPCPCASHDRWAS